MGVTEIMKVEPSTWLKEAIRGQHESVREAMVARIPHARERLSGAAGAVATRFPGAHEKLSNLSSTAVSLPGTVLERTTECYSATISLPGRVRLYATNKVRTVGFGLLDRTEAILDALLPLNDNMCAEDEEETALGGGDMKAKVSSIPRALLSNEVVRTIAVQLGNSTALRVTILCTREACNSLTRRVAGMDVSQFISQTGKNLELQLAAPGNNQSPWMQMLARFVNLQLSQRVAKRFLGKSAPTWLRPPPGLENETASVGPAAQGADREMFTIDVGTVPADDEWEGDDDDSDNDSERFGPQQDNEATFQMILKNSFIEFVECHGTSRFRSSSEPQMCSRGDNSCTMAPELLGCDDLDVQSTCAGSDTECIDENIGAASTTLQLRNIPINCSRDMLQQLLENAGFYGKFDFLYVPVNFSTGVGLGHAAVNMLTVADARELHRRFQRFSQWPVPSDLVCDVAWGEPQQNLDVLIDRYRNSPVMHASLPDFQRPAVFANGARALFPPPTKDIRRPRIRHVKAAGGSKAAQQEVGCL